MDDLEFPEFIVLGLAAEELLKNSSGLGDDDLDL